MDQIKVNDLQAGDTIASQALHGQITEVIPCEENSDFLIIQFEDTTRTQLRRESVVHIV